jgi:hypothetical protein
VIVKALTSAQWGDAEIGELRERTRALAERYPLYPQLTAAAAAV